MTASAQC